MARETPFESPQAREIILGNLAELDRLNRSMPLRCRGCGIGLALTDVCELCFEMEQATALWAGQHWVKDPGALFFPHPWNGSEA